jgi:hypothetical protein
MIIVYKALFKKIIKGNAEFLVAGIFLKLLDLGSNKIFFS